ncbi:MAG: amidohydrolase family protein [Muribaculaceae bacterium]|nr:amidohydrolase family protein [Muribaculaceae bacterium]
MNRIFLFTIGMLAILGMEAQKNITVIDVHSHVITDEYLKYLADNDALMEDGYPLPSWDERVHIAFMDSAGIDRSVLTLSSPQPWFGNLDESRKVIRSVNERMAKAKRDNPDRFLWCAALPQPDINASIDEAIYTLDTLGADGIKLATSVDGVYLGDSFYDPLMKVLDERGAVVILHPVKPNPVNESTFTGGPIFVYEYPAETTRAVLNMVAHNVMTRYPNIKVIVPHAGSFMPYAVPRLKGGYPLLLQQGLTGPIDIEGNLSRLYYDLAGGPSTEAIKMLLTVTTPDHLMFGTDYPFVPAPILEKVAAKVKNEILHDADLGPYAEDILRNNALGLFKTEQ